MNFFEIKYLVTKCISNKCEGKLNESSKIKLMHKIWSVSVMIEDKLLIHKYNQYLFARDEIEHKIINYPLIFIIMW